MKPKSEPSDEPLRALVRAARPDPPLPPRFREAVWRRLENEDTVLRTEPAALRWLHRWAERLLLPRFALASLALLLVAGGFSGFGSSANAVKEQAQGRYLAAVAPNILR